MQRLRCFLSLTLLLALGLTFTLTAAESSAQEEAAKCRLEGKNTDWKLLVSRAAAMSKAEWEWIVRNKPDAIPDNQPFTWLLLKLPITKQELAPAYQKEFKFFPTAAGELVKAIEPQEGELAEFASAVRPEFIVQISQKVSDTKTSGTVEFEAPDAYRGSFQFQAECIEGQWQITEFSLPARKVRCYLEDGKWKTAGLSKK